MYGEFQKLETIILGISPDGEASHQNFISKYDIPFNLLCDPQKKSNGNIRGVR
jgi:peroxiredoxin Q/BCP